MIVDDFIEIEDGPDSGGMQDVLIEDFGGDAGDLPIDALARQASQVAADNRMAPSGDGQSAPADTPSSDAPSDNADSADDDIVPDEPVINWAERAKVELENELSLLGIAPEEVADKESFIFVQDQTDYINQAIASNREFLSLTSELESPDVSLLETEIRKSLGYFATDKDVAERLASFINEDGSVNEHGLSISNKIKEEKSLKLSAVVDQIKADSKKYAAEQLNFYKQVDDSVSSFKPSVVKISGPSGEQVEIPFDLKASQKRQLKLFVESDYVNSFDGKGVPKEQRAAHIAENAFWLNRKLVSEYISSIAKEAYLAGLSRKVQ